MLLTTQRPPSPHPMGRGQGEGRCCFQLGRRHCKEGQHTCLPQFTFPSPGLRPPSPHPMGRGQGEGVSSLGDQEREREKSHVSQASRFPDAALVVGGVTTSCRGQLAVL